jgi:hypothetical protein
VIVLLLSAHEAQTLIDGQPDRGLSAYLARELQMERLLPDDNLPEVVVLRHLELAEGGRSYLATVTFSTKDAADRAWSVKAEDTLSSEATTGDVRGSTDFELRHG